MTILKQETNSNYNKLTLTKDEARIKLSTKLSQEQNERAYNLALDIIDIVDKSLLTKTLRGTFIYKDTQLSIKLKYNNRKEKCVVSFYTKEF